MKAPLVAALLAGTCFSTSQKNPNGTDPRDVTGNYDVTYDNHLTLKLNIGGAERTVTQDGYGAIADFGVYQGQPVKLDLTQFCNKPEVKCPSEQFWGKVSIDQPDLGNNNFNLQTLRVIDNTEHTLPMGRRAPSVTGLVDHSDADRYILGLGAQAGAQGACAAFDVSWANGRFSHTGETVTHETVYRDERGKPCNPDAGTMMVESDAGSSDGGASDGGVVHTCRAVEVEKITVPPNATADGIKEGTVGLFWAGGCAFGPFLVGATLSLETGYTAKRTGDFDPPPYTPTPVMLPDGGIDGGEESDLDGGVDAGP